MSRAADRQSCPVLEDRDPAVLCVGLQPGETVNIENKGTVNPDEAGRVEELCELREALLFQMPFPAGMNRDVIILRFDIVD
jgi:hypothetical protein